MSRPSAILDRLQESPVTWLVTALNLGVFVIAWQKGEHEGLALSGLTAFIFGGAYRPAIWEGEYWRLLTAVFIHGSWIHLLVNTWSMFGWCAGLERAVGSGWFAFAYLTTGVAGFAVSMLTRNAFAVGASGAAFGIIGVGLALLYRRSGSWAAFKDNPFVRQIVKNLVIWTVLLLMLSTQIDHFAHLGGFVFGVGCGLIVDTRRGRKPWQWFVAVTGYLVVFAAVVIAACTPGLGLGR